MTTITSISPYNALNYLNQVKGTTTTTTGSTGGSGSTSGSSGNTSNTGTGQVDLSSQVLSILQSANPYSDSGDLLSNLLNSSGNSTSDYLSGLYNSVLYDFGSVKPLSQTLSNSNKGLTPVSNALLAYQAQNNTSSQSRQTTQNVIDALLGSGNLVI